MNSPMSSNAGAAVALAPTQAILQSNAAAQSGIVAPAVSSAVDAQPIGYGLPCAKCRTYYSAALKNCPVCKTAERVSPTAVLVPVSTAALEAASRADDQAGTLAELSDVLEDERERFLQQFQSQVVASPAAINSAESSNCNLIANHTTGFDPAVVCQNCYENLQTRADLMEAALHIDMKEAAQLIYDAVWSDPSDPSKTYQNAAQALISELHKRAGISAVLGPFQHLAH